MIDGRELTPDEMAQMGGQALQGQEGYAPQWQPNNGYATPEDVEIVKQTLGLSDYEAKLKAQEEKLNEITEQAERQKAIAEVTSKFPNISKDKLIEKANELKEKDPDFWGNADKSASGLEAVAKAIKADMSPSSTPDNITDSADSSGEGKDKLKVTQDTTDIELGDAILELSK